MGNRKKKVFMGSDHAGIGLKNELIKALRKGFPGIDFEDIGCFSEQSVHYPEFAFAVGEHVGKGEGEGICVCGSGIGMAIAANKVVGVRASVVWDETSARFARSHNDVNIICVGERLMGSATVLRICEAWLTTTFDGGRHQLRVDMIKKREGGK